MEWIETTWTDLVNRYNDDAQSFEDYICSELDIETADFETLNKKFEKTIFRIRPAHDYIEYRGEINSDIRIAIKN